MFAAVPIIEKQIIIEGQKQKQKQIKPQKKKKEASKFQQWQTNLRYKISEGQYLGELFSHDPVVLSVDDAYILGQKFERSNNQQLNNENQEKFDAFFSHII